MMEDGVIKNAERSLYHHAVSACPRFQRPYWLRYLLSFEKKPVDA